MFDASRQRVHEVRLRVFGEPASPGLDRLVSGALAIIADYDAPAAKVRGTASGPRGDNGAILCNDRVSVHSGGNR